eukprot:jgi/Botrbrau1/4747/Bobra.0137s0019.1
MADSTHADEGANAGPNRPVSQIPGQGSPRLETLYRLFSVPTGILGLLMLLLPGQSAQLLFGSTWGWLAAEAASSAASVGSMGISAIAMLAFIPLRVLSGFLWLPRLMLGKTLGSAFQTFLQGFNWTDATISSLIGLSISRIFQGWLGWLLGFSWVRNLARQAVILATGQNFTAMGQNLGSVAADAIHKTTSGAGGLKSVGAKISAATPEGRMFSTQLRILGVALISAAVIKHLLARAARNGDLGKGPYLRLNVALLLWSLLSLVLVLCSPTVFSVFSFTLLVAITAGTVAFTLPQVLSTNVSGALDQAVREVRAGKTRRSWIYAMLALFFLLEGIGLVMTPGLTLRGAFGMNGGAVGNELWQLIGASAHVLVPIALLQLASAAERAKLASTVNATLNKVVLAVAATHVVTLLRHGLFGPVGPLGPPVLLAWATALGTTIYNLPSFGKLESQARITKQE